MSLVGKPRPGVCGRCGTAVVRSLQPAPEPGDDSQGGTVEVNGHKYVAGRLQRVRCKTHGGLGFEGDMEDCFGGAHAC